MDKREVPNLQVRLSACRRVETSATDLPRFRTHRRREAHHATGGSLQVKLGCYHAWRNLQPIFGDAGIAAGRRGRRHTVYHKNGIVDIGILTETHSQKAGQKLSRRTDLVQVATPIKCNCRRTCRPAAQNTI